MPGRPPPWALTRIVRGSVCPGGVRGAGSRDVGGAWAVEPFCRLKATLRLPSEPDDREGREGRARCRGGGTTRGQREGVGAHRRRGPTPRGGTADAESPRLDPHPRLARGSPLTQFGRGKIMAGVAVVDRVGRPSSSRTGPPWRPATFDVTGLEELDEDVPVAGRDPDPWHLRSGSRRPCALMNPSEVTRAAHRAREQIQVQEAQGSNASRRGRDRA